jgi:quinol monooxygenase YgiN
MADEPAAIVKIVAKDGCRGELTELLASMAAVAARDDGTEIYSVHTSREDGSVFFLYELYRDREALARHRSNAELAALGKQLGELVESVEIVSGNLVAGDRAVRSEILG